jgi:hypothetical protein
MAKSIVVGERKFPSQRAALEFARTIRDRYDDGEEITGGDAAFLEELLRLHPEANQKLGEGISYFSVQPDPVFGTTRHFVVHRKDGTSTDFSFKSCIEGSSARRDALSALREGVADQITGFKNSEFAGKTEVRCGVRGTLTKFRNAHVDHIPPRTYAALVTGWLRQQRITLEDIAVTPPADNQVLTTMTDEKQVESWQRFHRKYARLRIVCSEANLSDVRREKR